MIGALRVATHIRRLHRRWWGYWFLRSAVLNLVGLCARTHMLTLGEQIFEVDLVLPRRRRA